MFKNNTRRLVALMAFFVTMACLMPRIITTPESSDAAITTDSGYVELIKDFAVSAGLSKAYGATTGASVLYVHNPTTTSAKVMIRIETNGQPLYAGVVCSSTSSLPEHDGFDVYRDARTNISTGEHEFELYNLSPYTNYNVRAFIYNGSSFEYSAVYTFNTSYSGYMPTVYTSGIMYVSDSFADIHMDVTNSGGSSIVRRGIVFSKNNSQPTLEGYDSSVQLASGTMGTTTVRLSGLIPGTHYYVRAFATNSHGTAYGGVLTFYASSTSWNSLTSSWITTKSVSSITDTTAIAGGNISSSYFNTNYTSDYSYYYIYDYLERGVVYSTSSKNPTISDSYAVSNTSYSNSDFTVELRDLRKNSTYYVRAYVRTTGGYSYGDVVTFTTTGTGTSQSVSKPEGSVDISVVYKTLGGVVVGDQAMNVASGSVINKTNLKVPEGYRLDNEGYAYTARGIAVINVPVRKIGTDNAFMTGSDFKFEPNRMITRAEVAKLVHALGGNLHANSDLSFTDIDDNYSGLASVRYAVSRGYMTGYTDGTFMPDNNITRAEMALVVSQVYGQGSGKKAGFTDIAGHWAESAISIAAGNGILTGYPDGSFKPDANMTRAEACTMFSRAEKRDLSPIGSVSFTDVPASHWAYKYIMNAAIARK